jgi:hypothetical protein
MTGLTAACVRPPGIRHLEDFQAGHRSSRWHGLRPGNDWTTASISMDFIAGGLVEMIGGLTCAAVPFAYAWWAPVLLAGAWLATHWLLRESGVWRDLQYGSGPGRAARRGLRLPAGRRSRALQGASPVRARRLGHRTFRPPTHPPPYPAVRSHAAARATPGLEPPACRWRQRRRLLVAGCRGRGRTPRTQPSRHVCPDRHRHLDDRIRRAELGPGWLCGTGGGAPPEPAMAPHRRAPQGPARNRRAQDRDPFATSPLLTRADAGADHTDSP